MSNGDRKDVDKEIEHLAVLNRRSKDQNNYLETLILLTETYEADEIADALDPTKSSSLDVLKYLMEANGMSQIELAKLLKVGPSSVSMILSGNRPITADHARNLA